LSSSTPGLVVISVPIPIAIALVGFILGFYFVFRNSN
jgi:hypothetical protein